GGVVVLRAETKAALLEGRHGRRSGSPVEVEIFDSQRSVFSEQPFQAAANRVTGFEVIVGGVAELESARTDLIVLHAPLIIRTEPAAGHIKQPVIVSPADSSASRCVDAGINLRECPARR